MSGPFPPRLARVLPGGVECGGAAPENRLV